jgi:hypothetical protein
VTITAATWITDAKRYLLSGLVEQRNKLASSYTAGAGSLVFTYPLAGVTAGSRLSIGLNTFYVWAVNADGKTATVSGGEDGTTDADAASGAVVQVRPRFTDSELLARLNDELVSLSSPQNGLFQVKTKDLTYNPAVEGFDLTGVNDLQAIYEVRVQEPGPALDWPRMNSALWHLDRSAETSDFASGLCLKLHGSAYSGLTVRVVYKAPFTGLTTLTSDVAGTGVSTSAYDLPPRGAAIRLIEGSEIKRNFTESQPDTRRAGEVPSGARFNSYRGLLIDHQQRISGEAARLSQLYPPLRDI